MRVAWSMTDLARWRASTKDWWSVAPVPVRSINQIHHVKSLFLVLLLVKLTNVETNPNHIKPQLPRPLKQGRRSLNRRPELVTKLDQRAIVIGMDPQEQLSAGHKRLDRLQFVEIVERRLGHAHVPRSTQRRGRLARVRKDDSRRMHAETAHPTQFLDRGAVKAGS